MSLEIDFDKVCLICLIENDELVPVEENSTIMHKLSECHESWMELKNNTKLPNKMCPACVDDLEAAWRFRQNCKHTNNIFRNIYQQDEDFELEVLNEETLGPASDRTLRRTKATANSAQVKEQPGEEEEELHEEEIMEVEDPESDVVEEDENRVHLLDMGASDLDSSQCGTEHLRLEDSISEEVIADDLEDGAEKEQIAEPPTTKERAKRVGLNSAYEQFLTTLTKKGRGRPKKHPDAPAKKDAKPKTKYLNKKAATGPAARGQAKKTPKQNRDPKICEICGNIYKYQHALVAHMRRHNNERPFTCEVCNKGFVANVELQRHMRTHTGHKPYGCSYCDRWFADFGSRGKHERTHTGERPYVCQTCGKSFAYAHVLSVHMRIHTGDKRFKCDLCERGFTKKSYLEAHLEWHSKGSSHDVEYVTDDEAASQQQIILQQVGPQGDDEDAHFVEYNEAIKAVEVADDCIFTRDMLVSEVDDKGHDIYQIYTLKEAMSGEQLEEDDEDGENVQYTMVVA